MSARWELDHNLPPYPARRVKPRLSTGGGAAGGMPNAGLLVACIAVALPGELLKSRPGTIERISEMSGGFQALPGTAIFTSLRASAIAAVKPARGSLSEFYTPFRRRANKSRVDSCLQTPLASSPLSGGRSTKELPPFLSTYRCLRTALDPALRIPAEPLVSSIANLVRAELTMREPEEDVIC